MIVVANCSKLNILEWSCSAKPLCPWYVARVQHQVGTCTGKSKLVIETQEI